MKHLIFAVLFIATTFSAAFADNRPTKTQNDAAIKAGRTLLAAKTTILENNINSNNMAAAQTVATEVLDLMRKGMAQTYVTLNLESGTQQQAVNVRYMELERLTHEYRQLSGNVPANGKKMVGNAQDFLKKY